MIEVRITGDNAGEVLKQMLELVSGYEVRFTPTEPVEETVARVVEEAAQEAPAEAPKKRGRPKKEEPVTVAEEPAPMISASPEDRRDPAQEVEDAEVVEDAPTEAEPTATRAELYAAAEKLVGQIGMPDAMAWLAAETGKNRLKELPEDRVLFADLIFKIEEKLA
jgi:hypothetical protein